MKIWPKGRHESREERVARGMRAAEEAYCHRAVLSRCPYREALRAAIGAYVRTVQGEERQ